MMDVWLKTVNSLCDRIEVDTKHIMECNEEDQVLDAFIPTYGPCSSYKGCPYFNFCLTQSNPLQMLGEVPEGFKVEYWNPNDRDDVKRVNIEGGKII
jgi:hypothetical protein